MIKLIDASFSYRKDDKPILKNINLEISNNERIGLIGRTGAGKSTLVLALANIIELNEGIFTICDHHLKSIPISLLRNLISIMPQEPFIFEGTLE